GHVHQLDSLINWRIRSWGHGKARSGICCRELPRGFPRTRMRTFRQDDAAPEPGPTARHVPAACTGQWGSPRGVGDLARVDEEEACGYRRPGHSPSAPVTARVLWGRSSVGRALESHSDSESKQDAGRFYDSADLLAVCVTPDASECAAERPPEQPPASSTLTAWCRCVGE